MLEIPTEFVIWDTEFTSWEGTHLRAWSGPTEHKEIIQLCALRVSRQGNELEVKSSLCLYVKPSINPLLSDYIINLTGTTQEDIDIRGHSLQQALIQYEEFCRAKDGGYVTQMSWGPDSHVVDECIELQKLNAADYEPLLNECRDIRDFFRDHSIVTKRYSSGTVSKAVGLGADGATHNATWDCESIRLTVEHLLHGKGLVQDQNAAMERDEGIDPSGGTCCS